MTNRTVNLNVPVLARVEGEGALDLSIVNGEISELGLRIFEPPRLFEKFLEGRHYMEVPDMVARICGICPVAYQMSAVQALESILGIEPTPWIRDMRRLFYCGEWIESHGLHIHLLAAPDFLGFANAIDMAGQHPDIVRRGLRIQEAGNAIIRFLGGRSVHPVGVRVGGFWHAPSRSAAAALREELQALLPEAEALVLWTAALPLPNETQDFECVSLGRAGEYPITRGRIVSSRGLDIDIAEFDSEFKESHAPHSTALHCHHRGQDYLVGPLARLNLNLDLLPASTRKLAQACGMHFPSSNIFHSIVARALEIHAALVESIRLLEAYAPTDTPYLEAAPRAGVGFGASEAPRGILWHRYELDDSGSIVSARIVPPTSQNQARIEADLRTSLNHFGLDQPEEKIRHHAETVIRNYDPCISCATHFLKLSIDRT
ncbi:Ni/Fe hydrogenase subunit alpha [Betaproteobacteria bacterium SCN2]|jgi:coenzyme F420-reducing hydrogenase alpha subunit|nr:Ni/Fe hydrogenase subunit alpha [Betaproteobacteria bacterium SCN2]